MKGTQHNVRFPSTDAGAGDGDRDLCDVMAVMVVNMVVNGSVDIAVRDRGSMRELL